MIKWIPLSMWSRWTPQERGEVSQYYESIGQKWAIDLTSPKLGHDRIGEFEEYEGESESRHVDHRGFVPPGAMQIGSKQK